MTGIRKNTISELYNEIATRISLDHIDLICEALGCGLTDLLEITPNPEPRVKTHTSASLPDKGRK
ncbi:helix-turn-helix transcriptional regulator [Pseudoflavonifractor sp. 524-17]|uniref:helix-turn-helix domain-containing protein n=1 Tax=Pseudoflavonifractor sp. 524-17 TaxID=2304577 RepID=UPI00325B0207